MRKILFLSMALVACSSVVVATPEPGSVPQSELPVHVTYADSGDAADYFTEEYDSASLANSDCAPNQDCRRDN